MIKAVLDACVLYSAPLRDFLLRLAEAKLVQPYWSAKIQDEWMRNLFQKRPDLLRERLARTRDEMEKRFSRSVVSGFEELVPTLQLPDPNDRHVLAVAIRSKAPLIVTHNLNDFPKNALSVYQIEAISPDDFAIRVKDYDPDGFLDTVAKHRAGLTRPAKTVDAYLATLQKQGLTKTVDFLQKHRDKI